jgi:zinc/manganese transport system permease protein
LTYAFLRHALLASTAVALGASVVGYFLVGRGMTFAAHALPNIGFAGAMGAVLVGLPPFWGLVSFSGMGALAFSFLGKEARQRDQGIGIVMVLALGLGALFLSLYKGSSQRAYGILFGSILGIDGPEAWGTLFTSLAVVAAVVLLFRPLLFSTFDPEAAQAKGVPVRGLTLIFLLLAAVMISRTVPVTGTLLVFTLLVGPAATARLLTRRPGIGLLLSILFGEIVVCVGLGLAVWLDTIPVGFFVTALSFFLYLGVRWRTGGVPWKP